MSHALKSCQDGQISPEIVIMSCARHLCHTMSESDTRAVEPRWAPATISRLNIREKGRAMVRSHINTAPTLSPTLTVTSSAISTLDIRSLGAADKKPQVSRVMILWKHLNQLTIIITIWIIILFYFICFDLLGILNLPYILASLNGISQVLEKSSYSLSVIIFCFYLLICLSMRSYDQMLRCWRRLAFKVYLQIVRKIIYFLFFRNYDFFWLLFFFFKSSLNILRTQSGPLAWQLAVESNKMHLLSYYI